MRGESDLAGRPEAAIRGSAYVSSFFSAGSAFPQSISSKQATVLIHTRLWNAAVSAQRALWGCYLNPSSYQGIHRCIILSCTPLLLPVCHLVLLSQEGPIYISLIFQKSLVGSTVLLQYENYQASYSVCVTTYSTQHLNSGNKQQVSKITTRNEMPKSF